MLQWLQGGQWESTALQSEKVPKRWPDEAREYMYHPYCYLRLPITASAIAEKAKQTG